MSTDAFSTAAKQPSSDDTELEVLGHSSAAPHGSLGVKPSAQIRHTNLMGYMGRHKNKYQKQHKNRAAP